MMTAIQNCVLAYEQLHKLISDEYQLAKEAIPLEIVNGLIRPAQRLGNYKVMLQEIMNHLPKDGELYNNVNMRLEIIIKWMNNINAACPPQDTKMAKKR